MQVTLRRNGTDLSKSSSVFVRSRQTDPISARGKISWRVTETHLGFEMLIEHLILCYSPIILHSCICLYLVASEDYTPVIQMVYFAPYFERQSMEVTIRDDKGLPRVEGTETFELVLRTPINTGIKEPSNAVIAIDDSISDCKFSLKIFIHFKSEVPFVASLATPVTAPPQSRLLLYSDLSLKRPLTLVLVVRKSRESEAVTAKRPLVKWILAFSNFLAVIPVGSVY